MIDKEKIFSKKDKQEVLNPDKIKDKYPSTKDFDLKELKKMC